MNRNSVSGVLCVAGISLALLLPACGKKAPLRLIDDRSAVQAPALRARIRLDRVTLDFRVPAHRSFPEREDPWVLARILRQISPSSEVVEAGAILKADGFAFGAPLTWTDQVLPPKRSFIYRVEFRDATGRRRALSEPLAVSWDNLPSAPPSLSATGRLQSIVLIWSVPPAAGQALSYRIYRRESAQGQFEQAIADPVTADTYVDSRITPDLDYCYEVRAVYKAATLEIEGPASPESCSRSAPAEPLLNP